MNNRFGFWQNRTDICAPKYNMMKATIEISMYPLTEKYEQEVINFIQKVKKYEGLTAEVNGLSTMLFGEYELLMQVLTKEMKYVFENGKTVFVMKVAGSELTREKLPDVLK